MPRGKPPIGLPVQFFARPGNTDDICAATVIKQFDNGAVDLQLHTPTGGSSHRRGVFMRGDPELEKRKDTDWANHAGVWDYLPGMPRIGEVSDEDLELAILQEQEEAKKRARNAKSSQRQKQQLATAS